MTSGGNDLDRTAIGYKKPPLETRFKPGQSGNRNGRPKGKKNIYDSLWKELLTTVIIKENGLRKRITKEEALIKQVVNKAVAGDPKMMMILLSLAGRQVSKVDIPATKCEDDKSLLSSEMTIEDAEKYYKEALKNARK